MRHEETTFNRTTRYREASSTRGLLRDATQARLWLIARLYVGWVWLNVGWALLQSRAWVGDGSALRTAWSPSTSTEAWVHGEQGWSGGLTAFLVETIGSGWLAKLTAIGITIAAIALLLGLASGIASVVGVLMSANVMVAGSTAIDPLILVIAIGIALSWKTAGQIGLDRWFLPLVSEPVRNAVVSGTHHSRAHKAETSMEVSK